MTPAPAPAGSGEAGDASRAGASPAGRDDTTAAGDDAALCELGCGKPYHGGIECWYDPKTGQPYPAPAALPVAVIDSAANLAWKATPYGETEDGAVRTYILPAGAVHRLVGAMQGAGFTCSLRSATKIAKDDQEQQQRATPAATPGRDEASTRTTTSADRELRENGS